MNGFLGCSLERLASSMIKKKLIPFFSYIIKQDSISRQVYTIYIFFAKNSDEEISQKAIVGLGRCLFHSDFTKIMQCFRIHMILLNLGSCTVSHTG